jgi:GT2 family glycosyltransferase
MMATRPDPLVSVIVIFLDAGKYLAEAIRSVQCQTLSSWELVLVDDGSSDDSRQIAARYAALDPERVRPFEHPGRQNLGTGPSRNLGMRVARGRYIVFLDADDVYEPERLERPVEILEADPDLGVVLNREVYWRTWQQGGTVLERLARRPDEVVGPAAPYNRVIPPPALIASTLATAGAAMPAICSITFRRQAILDLGGVPEQFASQYEDQALIAKLLLSCPAMVIEDCLARYRQHDESLTHRAEKTGEYRPGMPHPERQRFVRWLKDYASGIGIHEPVLLEALEGELQPPAHHLTLAPRMVWKRLRRLLLLTANALLPRATVDRLILRDLERQKARAAATAAAHTVAIERRLRASPKP